MRPRLIALVVALASTTIVLTGTAHAALKATWMPGVTSPGTPARLDRVGVIKVGPAHARNVLVIEPGTSAGGAYFVPLARWIVSRANNWQVWAVERRENLLDDQSELNLAKHGKATVRQLFNYYLGYISDRSVTHHFHATRDSSVEFAKTWGMNVAVQDLHRVIETARRLGGKVVLGGHSLGGSVVTAYATWSFGRRAGADDLAGLVYIDGGSGQPIRAAAARRELTALNSPSASPWLSFGGIPAPLAGVFNATGSAAALIAPNAPSDGQASGLLTPFHLSPSLPVTNAGQYGWALNYKTSPASLLAAQAHLGAGLSARPTAGYYGWDGTGALTPLSRFATMFSGVGIDSANGTEWYFPQRLTDDTGAVGNGLPNPAQRVLGVHSTMGRHLPTSLHIFAFGARLGGEGVLLAATALARQSHIPRSHLTLINRQATYSHNDPAGAYPQNAFFSRLIPFLAKLG
jgi:hypothetical protein